MCVLFLAFFRLLFFFVNPFFNSFFFIPGSESPDECDIEVDDVSATASEGEPAGRESKSEEKIEK